MDTSKKGKIYLMSVIGLNAFVLSLPFLLVAIHAKIADKMFPLLFIVWPILNISNIFALLFFPKPLNKNVKIGATLSFVFLIFILWGIWGFRQV